MDKILKSEWAQRLLDDDFFKDVIEELKSAYIRDIIQSNEDGISDREIAYQRIKFLDQFVGHLEGMAAERKIQEKKWKIW